MLAEEPDVVVIATGGLPNLNFLAGGRRASPPRSWDILTGAVKPAAEVDPSTTTTAPIRGMTAAEFIAESGSRLEDRHAGARRSRPMSAARSYPPYFRAFSARHDVRGDAEPAARAIWSGAGTGSSRSFHDEYGQRTVEKEADQVVDRIPARCRSTNSTSSLKDAFGEPWRGGLRARWSRDGRRRCAAIRTAAFACSASATPWRAATSTPPSSTRTGSWRGCDSFTKSEPSCDAPAVVLRDRGRQSRSRDQREGHDCASRMESRCRRAGGKCPRPAGVESGALNGIETT